MKSILQGLPYGPIAVVLILWYAYGMYSFETSPDSPLNQKRAQIASAEQARDEVKKKVEEARRFFAELEQKRAELRALAVKLTEMRNTLSENQDLTGLTDMIVTEGKKAGLRVQSIIPSKEEKKEFVVQQDFELKFRGVFGQLIVFLSRLSDAKKILRTEQFELSPFQDPRSGDRYVDLRGTVIVSSFRYNRSKADEIAEENFKKAEEQSKPANSTPPGSGT